ncbi:golvesin C-terminal-like domain-containing protein [Streptomyces sp. NPDC001205]
MTFSPRTRTSWAVLTAGAALVGLIQATAWAQEPSPPSAAAAAEDARTQIPAKSRDSILGKGWKTSQDRAWTTSGDGSGFHILTADKRDGYAWHTAATLSEPGFDVDTWIGNACVTGSGRRAVVAYAPRTFTNKPELMARGAFTAVVDLDTGRVTKLNRQASLAYFSPGCGTDESAVLTQSGGEDKNTTRLLKVNAATASLGKPLEVAGQVTSAVPVNGAIVAADANRLVRITDDGRRTQLVRTQRIPFLLKPDTDGGVVYMDRSGASGDTGEVRRLAQAAGPVLNRGLSSPLNSPLGGPSSATVPAQAQSSLLATGPLTSMDLTSSAAGRVYITGAAKATAPLPPSVELRPQAPVESVATTRGESMVTRTTWADGNAIATNAAERPAAITLAPVAAHETYAFTVAPSARVLEHSGTGAERSPALAAPAAPKAAAGNKPAAGARSLAGPPAEGTDTRYCAVARNDPNKQAMQPKPRQVEWAVDQAITGNLNKFISRPANWKNLGMAAYQPQFLFPLHDLDGGGRVPAQVMLGITAQESNMWQASRVAVPGVTANPLVGNFYGVQTASSGQQPDPWAINWKEADCGYGITQVTDGMRLAGKEKPNETAMSVTRQEAVALDYTANIAAGVNILIDKWNDTRRGGLVINNGDPKYLENWFFALWSYNTGFYPKDKAAQNHGVWGVGFTNNPANPIWKANRRPFLQAAGGGDNYADAAHPQDWPYQEKVMGWAARPLSALESPGTMVAGYRQAWWNNDYYRTMVKPAESLFCTAANECDPSKIGDNDRNVPGFGACNRQDLYCFWNQPVTWKNCANGECGNETLRFNNTLPEEPDGTAYPPNCATTGLPAGALIVDDVPNATPVHRPNCTPPATTGSFDFDFATESSRMDLHQLGAGFASHFWFTHTRKNDATGTRMQVTGTWSLGRTIPEGQAKVLVHLPDHGAQTAQATYQIITTDGVQTKTVNQKGSANRWVELGTYRFKDTVPQVKLTNITADGTGDQDIAYDAVAFVPGRFTGVDITLTEVDPNAPNVDWASINGPASMTPPTGEIISPTQQGTSALRSALPRLDSADHRPAAAAPPAAKDDCGAPNARGIRGCLRALPQPVKPAGPLAMKRSAAAGATGDLVSWCVPGTNQFTRFEACMHMQFQYIGERIYPNKPPEVIGSADFDVNWQLQLNQKSGSFKQQMSVRATRIDTALGGVSLTTRFHCFEPHVDCVDQPVQWQGAQEWALGDSHTATATKENAWTNPASGANGAPAPGWDPINFTWAFIGSSPTASTPTRGVRVMDDDALFQCDNFAINNTVGCSFGAYVPTYQFNSKKYPAAAAHAWLVQNVLPSHLGSKTNPMHFLPNKKNKWGRDTDDNRKVICPDNWPRHPDVDTLMAPELTTSTNPDSRSCDEFAFAGTYESGGMPRAMNGRNEVESGGQCLQTVARRVGGVPMLQEDERSALPTFQEACGRSSMSGYVNSGSMNRMGGFAQYFRLLDSDTYYVSVPGFQNCPTQGPLIQCKMTP